MDKELEKIWNSYLAQNLKFNLKSKYQADNVGSEQVINEIASLCGESFTKQFISWLYDYISYLEKIAFEVGYIISEQQKIGK